MRLLHSEANTSAQFDDPNLVSCTGLVPVTRLAQRCDLAALVGEHLKVTIAVGANAPLKVGMIVGADSIDDLVPRPDHPVSDLDDERIKRRPALGGLINEYEHAA